MYTHVIKLSDGQFRRKTGVKRATFTRMVEVVKGAEEKRKKLAGRPSKLCYEDQVLMSLEYLREYRTYFSLGHLYGVSESNCYKICKKVEDILIQSKDFRLPNRKDLHEDPTIEVVVVDAAESPIERPKKSNGSTTQARKRGTRSKRKSSFKHQTRRYSKSPRRMANGMISGSWKSRDSPCERKQNSWEIRGTKASRSSMETQSSQRKRSEGLISQKKRNGLIIPTPHSGLWLKMSFVCSSGSILLPIGTVTDGDDLGCGLHSLPGCTITNYDFWKRSNKFQRGVLGYANPKAKHEDIELKTYAKYILNEGTNEEKRELMGCFKSKVKITKGVVTIQ